MSPARRRKLTTLSSDLELAILSGMIKRFVPLDAVEPEELSKLGKYVLVSLKVLDKPTPDDILLHAAEVQGAPRDILKAFLHNIGVAGAGVETADILRKVRDKQALLDVINEAGAQIQRGTLDMGLITSLLSAESGSPVNLVTVSEQIKDGLPPKPIGTELKSLPRLSQTSGGVMGMWALGGEPGVGKSTLAWQIGLDVARTMPVLIYDFENGFAVMMDHTKEIFGGDLKRIKEATANLYYRDSIRSLDTDLARVPAPALIVVDSIQKLTGSIEFRRASLDRWIHRLEYLKKRGYSILIVSEIGRASYGHDAYIGAYKETGEIEYSADFGFQLLEGAGTLVELHIVKNRHRPYKGLAVQMRRSHSWLFSELSMDVPEYAALPSQEVN